MILVQAGGVRVPPREALDHLQSVPPQMHPFELLKSRVFLLGLILFYLYLYIYISRYISLIDIRKMMKKISEKTAASLES